MCTLCEPSALQPVVKAVKAVKAVRELDRQGQQERTGRIRCDWCTFACRIVPRKVPSCNAWRGGHIKREEEEEEEEEEGGGGRRGRVGKSSHVSGDLSAAESRG
ncbi:hypothetical protein TcWFU_006486 [Taenia crassiceps]|uniref:Uncharacterized protein n=1 Tax=Taenia crassiceps TaxID=6207 RepID=A0ABR4QH78_9CEST